jgi:hypothetical protein
MKYTRIDPPAFLADLASPADRDRWSAKVAGYFVRGVTFNDAWPGVTSQFYNPLVTETDDPHDEPVIDWPAFPKLVKDAHPGNPEAAYRQAEADADARKEFQDEYLEWHVVRSQGKITRVSFTCETTQYYEFLAERQPAKLLEIYQALVDPAFKDQVQLSELIVGGAYDGENRWNTEHGAVHLIQPNNNLFAEVMIAAAACILRRNPDGSVATDPNYLIECARYGAAGRASDPKIGAVVNDKARHGYSVSLRNPVALYMTRWDSAGLRKPNGDPVGNYWTLVRGKPAPGPTQPAMGLHLVYEVPAGEGFVVGDIKAGGDTIRYGGQLAERIHVGLVGLLCRENGSHNPSHGCGATPPGGGIPGVEMIAHVADADGLPTRARRQD